MAEENAQIEQLLTEVKRAFEDAGCAPFFSTQTQVGLRHDVGRIRRHVTHAAAEAWVVLAGSREVLEWFAAQAVPCLTFAGRWQGVEVAAVTPDKVPAYHEITRRLIGLGHERIVLLCGRLRRLPEPGRTERAFLEELAAHGITGPHYHLPDWDETPEGFQQLLTELFRVSPPTALIIDEVRLPTATLQFLAHRKLGVPDKCRWWSAMPTPLSSGAVR